MSAALQFVPASYSSFKWSRFRKIAPACWERANAVTPGLVISQLSGKWCEHFFEGAVTGVSLLTQAGGTPLAMVFRLATGIYDARVFSRVRPGDYYDFFWDFGDSTLLSGPGCEAPLFPVSAGCISQRTIQIKRGAVQGPGGSANVIWRVDPQAVVGTALPQMRLIRVYCSELDETIDINLDTLAIQFKESQVEKAANLAPWQRLLKWMWHLRSADSGSFGRLPSQLKSYLSNIRQAGQLEALTEANIQAWQSQKVLPQHLPWFLESDVAPARDCITRQQGISRSSDVLVLFNNCNPVPKVLHTLVPAQLGPWDLQSLIVIGALQEMHGYSEVERHRIIVRRPDLQALLSTPQGARRLEEDSEILAVKSHPDAIGEMQDQQDIMMRRQGNFGPTPRDMQLAMIQQAQMTNVQLSMVNPIMGVLGAMENAKLSPQAGPPWKVYRPYLC